MEISFLSTICYVIVLGTWRETISKMIFYVCNLFVDDGNQIHFHSKGKTVTLMNIFHELLKGATIIAQPTLEHSFVHAFSEMSCI